MKTVLFQNLTVELVSGDIIDQADCDAIVNAANARLRTGSGVAGAIHGKGDPELGRETRKFAPLSPGQAVITSAPNLPNKYVIHCLGPVYGKDKPEDKLLSDCYSNALWLAEEHGITSVAFPSISTGVFGYPMRDAAKVAFQTVKTLSADLKSIRLVRFVLWSAKDFNLHWEVLKEF